LAPCKQPKPASLGGVEGVRFDVSVVEELRENHRRVCETGCADTVKVADGRMLWQPRVERTRPIVLEDVEGEMVIRQVSERPSCHLRRDRLPSHPVDQRDGGRHIRSLR